MRASDSKLITLSLPAQLVADRPILYTLMATVSCIDTALQEGTTPDYY